MASTTPVGTTQRLVDCPDKNLLTMLEVSSYLGFESTKTLGRLIAAGEFPQALEVSDKGKLWPWRDVLYYLIRIELRPRLVADPPKSRKRPDGQGGTETDTEGQGRTSGKRTRPDA